MPRYLLLLHDAGTMPEGIGPDEIQAIIQRYVDWRTKVEAAGHAVMGHKLRDNEGRVMRAANGRVQRDRRPVCRGPRGRRRAVRGRRGQLRRGRRRCARTARTSTSAPSRSARSNRPELGPRLTAIGAIGRHEMDALVDQLFRRQSGRLVGMLTRQLGSHRLSLAEDAVQDALVRALQTWPLGGVPDNPDGVAVPGGPPGGARSAAPRARRRGEGRCAWPRTATAPSAALPEHAGALRRRRAGHDVHDLPSGAGPPTRGSPSR